MAVQWARLCRCWPVGKSGRARAYDGGSGRMECNRRCAELHRLQLGGLAQPAMQPSLLLAVLLSGGIDATQLAGAGPCWLCSHLGVPALVDEFDWPRHCIFSFTHSEYMHNFFCPPALLAWWQIFSDSF